jgi:hypothetical protein
MKKLMTKEVKGSLEITTWERRLRDNEIERVKEGEKNNDRKIIEIIRADKQTILISKVIK